MGGKSAPPPPPVPDYAGLANQQATQQNQLTQQQTWANRPDVNTPWGSQSWGASSTTDPSTGQPVTRWQQNVSLNPQQQSALDSQMKVQTGLSDQASSFLGRVQGSMNEPADWNNLPAQAITPQAGRLNTQVGGAGDYTSKAGDAVYNRATSRLDPQFAQKQESTDAALLGRGLTRGSEAWNRAQTQLGNERTDAYAGARATADSTAAQEAQRMQQMDLSSGQFGNAAQSQAWNQALQGSNFQNQNRQQSIAEQQTRRSQPLNELNALLSGQQVGNPNFPQFQTAGAGTAPNIMGATGQQYNAAMDQYNAGINSGNAQQQNAINGTTALAAMYFSDRQLKRGIKYVSKTKRGTPVYLYTMHGKLCYGVIAQEAPADSQWNVGGLIAVDYSKV